MIPDARRTMIEIVEPLPLRHEGIDKRILERAFCRSGADEVISGAFNMK